MSLCHSSAHTTQIRATFYFSPEGKSVHEISTVNTSLIEGLEIVRLTAYIHPFTEERHVYAEGFVFLNEVYGNKGLQVLTGVNF